MKKLLFSLSLLLLPSLLNAQTLTVDDIRVMHEQKMRVQFADDEAAHVVAADTEPARLLEAELFDVSGSPLYEVPPWLKRLTNLRKLDLSGSYLGKESSIAADTLAELSKALQAMPQLDVLNLADNPLFAEASEQSLAQVWQALPQLRQLNLSNTQGKAQNYGSLAALTKLSELDLSRNRIGNELAVLELNKLHQVKILNLSDTGMSKFPEQALPTTLLQQLDMSDNSFEEVPFVDMPELESWNLKMKNNGPVRLALRYGDSFRVMKIRHLSYNSGSDYNNLSELPKGLPEKIRKNSCTQEKIEQYIDNCDGTITDTKTGLMWKRCSEGLSGINCEQGEVKRYTWTDAAQQFKNIQYAGYTNWRLPTFKEMATLLYCSNGKNETQKGFNYCSEGSKKPTIHQYMFPNTPLSYYWSIPFNTHNYSFPCIIDFEGIPFVWKCYDKDSWHEMLAMKAATKLMKGEEAAADFNASAVRLVRKTY